MAESILKLERVSSRKTGAFVSSTGSCRTKNCVLRTVGKSMPFLLGCCMATSLLVKLSTDGATGVGARAIAASPSGLSLNTSNEFVELCL